MNLLTISIIIISVSLIFVLTILLVKNRTSNFFQKQLLQTYSEETKELKDEAQKLKDENIQLNIQLSAKSEQLKKMEEIGTQMKLEFSKISTEILKEQGTQFQNHLTERAREFQTSSEEKLSGITRPLDQKISEFRIQIEEYRATNLIDRGYLDKTMQDLLHTTQTLSQAFTKDKKLRGTWGEQQLTLMLEQSGLVEGRDFQTQVSVQGASENIQYIDVLISLPNDQHIIIDAKTPFDNYQRMLNADSQEERERFRKIFLNDVKKQIQDLGSKNYSQGKKEKHSLQSPPVVFMFISIDSACLLAMEDEYIQNIAREQQIMLSSPQSLFTVLKMIQYIWQLNQQDKNSLKILELARQIVEKAERIPETIEKIERSLEGTHKRIQDLKTPITGRGGLISLGKQLDSLGVKNSLGKNDSTPELSSPEENSKKMAHILSVETEDPDLFKDSHEEEKPLHTESSKYDNISQ